MAPTPATSTALASTWAAQGDLPALDVTMVEEPRTKAKLGRFGAYEVTKKLGEGEFASVYRARRAEDPEVEYAIKAIDKANVQRHNSILKSKRNIRRVNLEVLAMRRFRHGGICQLYEVMQTPSYVYLVLEMGERDLSLVLEVEGEFLETFELENFPIDYQELTIKLRTACAREGGMPCEFCQHSMKSSALNVDTANFSLKNVWRLEPNIDATITTHHAMAGRSYPCLFLTAHVHRKPGLYVVNVVAPMGLFALMTMLR